MGGGLLPLTLFLCLAFARVYASSIPRAHAEREEGEVMPKQGLKVPVVCSECKHQKVACERCGWVRCLNDTCWVSKYDMCSCTMKDVEHIFS